MGGKMIIRMDELEWEDGLSQSILTALITVDDEWEIIKIKSE